MGVSFITPEGGTKKDIYSRLGKARKVFRDMNNIWRSIQHSTNTKQKLYQSCVVSTLLYGSEYWRIAKTNITIIRHDTPAQKISWSYELLNRCNTQKETMKNAQLQKPKLFAWESWKQQTLWHGFRPKSATCPKASDPPIYFE